MARTLYVPERRKGRGSGHLRRCLELLRRGGGGVLFLPQEGDPEHHTRLQALVNAGARVGELEEERFLSSRDEAQELLRRGEVDRVLFDCQELSLEALEPFAEAPLLLGVDTGGEAEGYLDLTLEAIPRLPEESRANRKSTGYLTLPEKRRPAWPRRVGRLLVTLGGEDAGGRAASLAGELAALFPELEIYHTEGGTVQGPPATFVGNHEPLREKLHHFDLVVLHFGMTLFEALYARVPVLTLPVTDYHRRLAAVLDLDQPHTVEVESIAPEVGRIVTDPSEVVERCEKVAPREKRALEKELSELSPPRHRNPLRPRGALLDPVEARLEDRSYYRCSVTGLLYMRRFLPHTIEYTQRYFFEEYKRQYGRTYLEDFDHIRNMARPRLRRIKRLLPPGVRPGRPARRLSRQKGPSLLDVGCAYGPFLAAAGEAGFDVYGLDVAEDAVRHVREKLRLPAAVGSLEHAQTERLFGRSSFEVITMWYVIEHLPDLEAVLTRVGELLTPGGLFAFATPNGEGISATTNREQFLRASPEDHLSIWEPSRTAAILQRFDLEVAGITVTGHHPERFPSVRGNPRGLKAALLKPFLRRLSHLRGLGDTFECYARAK